jgi:hypothetical protein
MTDFPPDMERVRALAADCLRHWMRNLGPIDLGWYAEEGDWPELFGETQLPARHQHLFMAAVEEAVRTAVATFTWPTPLQPEAGPNAIDNAVEHVVRIGSSDHQALTEAVRILAGELGYGLVPKGAEPVVHRYFGGHWNFGTWVAACGQPDPSHSVTHFGGEITCPGCLASLSDGGIEPDPQPVAAEFLDRLHATTAVEHEDGPEPTPRDGEHGTCAACGGAIRYIDCPTGGWWAHETHPADGHDAELGGPA